MYMWVGIHTWHFIPVYVKHIIYTFLYGYNKGFVWILQINMGF